MRSDTVIKKRLWLLALLVVVLIASAFPMFASAEPDELEVGPGYTYSTIQAAIDAASEGDTITVHDNTTAPDYMENIHVTVNHLTIREADGEDVTVMADNASDNVFHVTADNVTIRGLDIYGATGSGKAGIYLDNTTNCTILDNRCGWDVSYNNAYGVYLYLSNSNTLTNNTCNYPLSRGIYLYSSSSNTLSGNTCNNSALWGINLILSSNNTLTNNTCKGNSTGMRLQDSTRNTLLENTMQYNAASKGLDMAIGSDGNTIAGNYSLDNG